MATAYDSSVSGGSLTSGVGFSFNNVAGNAMVVIAGREWFGVNVSSITYNGVSLTLSRNANYSTFYGDAGGYLMNPATGAHDVVITMTGTPDNLRGSAISVSGVDTSALDDFDFTHTNATNSISTPALTSQTGGIVVSGLVAYDPDVWSVTSPGVSRTSALTGNDRLILATHDGAATVTPNYTLSFSNGDATVMGWAFKPAGGAAATSRPVFPTFRMTLLGM